MSSPDRPPFSNPAAPRAFTGVDRLHGIGSYARLANSAVVVVGIGGVGSWAAEALARHGIGNITLVDLDHVAESNINRQLQALQNTLGMPKVDALAERINSINPLCIVKRIEDFLSPAFARMLDLLNST
jgi:tRNA A37 threonylcarbamoyladenosine dehydratase